jgi:hypothetical protein
MVVDFLDLADRFRVFVLVQHSDLVEDVPWFIDGSLYDVLADRLELLCSLTIMEAYVLGLRFTNVGFREPFR